jgi:conserved oligomeric Golgi complex subunit 3
MQRRWGISTLTNLGLELVSSGLPVPRVLETNIDSKLSVNMELKRVCEEMILDTAKPIIEPLSSFMIKVTAFNLKMEKEAKSGSNGASVGRLGMQPFASPQECVAKCKALLQGIDKNLGEVVSKMADYLGDKRTEAVLLLHLKVF